MIYYSSIIAVLEEDTMGTVFNSYSITIGHAWRIVIYHLLLLPLLVLGLEIFSWFSMNSIGFINYIFGCEWFMGAKLTNITNYAYFSYVCRPINLAQVCTFRHDFYISCHSSYVYSSKRYN